MTELALYDIVGDLHGCTQALRDLADLLGYDAEYRHPQGRKLVFVGDIADRGPDNVGSLRLVLDLVETGRAWSVLGNHDEGLLRHLLGEWDGAAGGVAETGAEIDAQRDAAALRERIVRAFSRFPLLLTLDFGRLIVAHAGIEDGMLNRPIDAESARFILQGDEIGKSPEGKTLRRDWAADYHGEAFIVYGHTPQNAPLVRENSANIDTGAYRKHALTALRWPERQIVSVPSV